MRELLVVIDYQNDFVTGALGNPAAAALEPGIDRVGWSSGRFSWWSTLLIFSSGTNTSVHFGFKTLEASAPRQWLRAWMGDSAAAGAVCMVLGAVLHVFCMQPFQFPLYLKGLCRDIRGLLRLPAECLLANGIVAGGFLAYFLFWHPSYSQLYLF